MSRRVSLMAVSLTLLLVALGACGGDAAPSATSTDSVEPSASPETEAPGLGKPDLVLRLKTVKGVSFDKETLAAPTGAVAKVVYTNQSGLAHNFTLVNGTFFGAPSLAQTRTTNDPKPQSDVFTVPDEPGRYLYFCMILGHGPKMRGVLIVK